MRKLVVSLIAIALLCGFGAIAMDRGVSQSAASIERGRYIARIAGCNDCHTPGYAQTGGKAPEAGWLTGDALG